MPTPAQTWLDRIAVRYGGRGHVFVQIASYGMPTRTDLRHLKKAVVAAIRLSSGVFS